jgi:CDP-6-deoxy-D-xylo-4-hexulose-3-dehydrase
VSPERRNDRNERLPTCARVARNLVRQPYMQHARYRVSGDLTNTENVMNNTFWIGVQPSLSRDMLEYAARKIETYLGVNF